MALRMLLTAMVVTMSLPMPSGDTCRKLIDDVNREFAAIADSLREEWEAPASIARGMLSESTQVAQGGTPSDLTDELAKADQVFDLIQEQFVREAEAEKIVVHDEKGITIDHARAEVVKIPAERVDHPLPPAPAADEVLPSVSEMIRSVLAEVPPQAVDTASQIWIDELEASHVAGVEEPIVIGKSQQVAIGVKSEAIGPWSEMIDDIGVDSEKELARAIVEELARIERAKEPRPIVVDSVSTNWDAILGIRNMSQEVEVATTHSVVKNDELPETAEASFREAFRKTAEAVALWSKVLARPF